MISSLIPETTLAKNHGGTASTTESNLPSIHSANLEIDMNATKLISMLTNLYSDENLAVLREYSTNAYDSHVAAGVTEPIQIDLPSSFNSQLVIRDFGLGLSKDEIINVYAKYGASTKGERLDQVGAFGLGGKSGLSLASQFTVIAVKDGMKTVTVIHQGNDGVPGYNIVSEEATDERNSVTVSIAVPNASHMRSRADSFFSTWQPGTVLVDGKEPNSVWNTDNEFYRRDGFLVTPSRGYHSSDHYVVMGNVKYRIDMSKFSVSNDIAKALRRVNFYMEVPIGSLDLPPNREEIRYSEFSQRFLAKLYTNIAAEMRKIAVEEVTGAPDMRSAMKAAFRWDYAGFAPTNGFVYNKIVIVRHEELEGFTSLAYTASKGASNDNSRYRRSKEDLYRFSYDASIDSDIVFVQIDPKVEGQEDSVINRFRSYVASKDAWNTRFIISTKKAPRLMREAMKIKFVKGADVIAESTDYAREQRAIKKAEGYVAAPREKVAVTYAVKSVIDGKRSEQWVTLEELSKLDGKVFFVRDRDFDASTSLQTHSAISKTTMHVVTLLSGQRAAAVEKALPAAEKLPNYGQRSTISAYTTENVTLSEEDATFAWMAYGSAMGYGFRSVILTLIRFAKDNSLGEEIDTFLTKYSRATELTDAMDYSAIQSLTQAADTEGETVQKMRALCNSVPLLSSMRYDVADTAHVVEYIKHFVSTAI